MCEIVALNEEVTCVCVLDHLRTNHSSVLQQLAAMREALSFDEASRAVIGLKNERDKIQNEYEKLDAEFMLTSLELW